MEFLTNKDKNHKMDTKDRKIGKGNRSSKMIRE